MKKITILIVLLVVLVFLKYSRFNEGFNEGFESGGKSVIICKAEWCGHCKDAAPEFQKLVQASPITLNDGSKATVTMLDADTDKDAMAKYNVKGFPTILIGDGASMRDYSGPRTYDGVVEELNK